MRSDGNRAGANRADLAAPAAAVAAADEVIPGRHYSYWGLSVRRLARKKLAMVCLSLIALMYGGALLAPLITPYEYTAQDLSQSRAGPSLAHPFGADRLGRDMLTRVIYGLRTTVIITITSLLGGTLLLGLALGAAQRLYGALGGFSHYADGRNHLLVPRHSAHTDFCGRLETPFD